MRSNSKLDVIDNLQKFPTGRNLLERLLKLHLEKIVDEWTACFEQATTREDCLTCFAFCLNAPQMGRWVQNYERYAHIAKLYFDIDRVHRYSMHTVQY